MKIKPSNRNTNKHTEVGMELLEKSISTVGVIESIATATDGTIITGHARHELFVKNGLKPKFIKLEKDEFPVIETNIENNTKEYFEAQILANTTANKNFNLDIEAVEVICDEYEIDVEEVGVDFAETDFEIEKTDNVTEKSTNLYQRNIDFHKSKTDNNNLDFFLKLHFKNVQDKQEYCEYYEIPKDVNAIRGIEYDLFENI